MFADPHVTRIDQDDVIVLSPIGEFDISSAEILRGSLLDALHHAPRLAIDLSGTRFLDSIALGAIVGAARRAQESGGWIRLVAPPNNVRRVLRITEIDRVLGLYDTVEQAVRHTEPVAG